MAVVEEGSAMAKIKRQVPMMRTLESNAAPSPSSPITIGVTIQTAVSMIRTVVCYQAVGGLADGTGAAMAVWHENTRPSGTKLS